MYQLLVGLVISACFGELSCFVRPDSTAPFFPVLHCHILVPSNDPFNLFSSDLGLTKTTVQEGLDFVYRNPLLETLGGEGNSAKR